MSRANLSPPLQILFDSAPNTIPFREEEVQIKIYPCLIFGKSVPSVVAVIGVVAGDLGADPVSAFANNDNQGSIGIIPNCSSGSCPHHWAY
jgi:hypothetical protein